MTKSNYRYYKDEELEIDTIDSRLSSEEKEVRRYLMNYVINNQKSFKIDKLDDTTHKLDRRIIDSLIDKNAIVADDEGNINFIYPVSALETDHIVRLSDGRKFYAMCAIDAMGSAFTFKQDVAIKSKCSNTAKDINVTIKSGKLLDFNPGDLHILHTDLNKNSDWSGNC